MSILDQAEQIRRTMEIRSRAYKFEGTITPDYYVKAIHRHTCMCKLGHTWSVLWTSMICWNWCQECKRMDAAKLHMKEANELASKFNGQCLSKEWTKSCDYLEWKCNVDGHPSWQAIIGSVRVGHWCKLCHLEGSRRKTYDAAFVAAANRGGRCCSSFEDYHRANALLWYECEVNPPHCWKSIPSSIAKGHWCPTCYLDKHCVTIQDAYNTAKRKGGKCLSSEMSGCNDKLLWQCGDCNYEWRAGYPSVNRSSWCPRCGGRLPLTQDRMHEIASLNEGECLSEIVNNATNIIWRCRFDHEWTATPANILKGSWCPICNESRGERSIRNILIQRDILFKSQASWSTCCYKRPLKFDFYLPSHHLLIEYDGEQHFWAVEAFGGMKKFDEVREKDGIKNSWVKDKGYSCIRIGYWEFNDIEKIIDETLQILENKNVWYYRLFNPPDASRKPEIRSEIIPRDCILQLSHPDNMFKTSERTSVSHSKTTQSPTPTLQVFPQSPTPTLQVFPQSPTVEQLPLQSRNTNEPVLLKIMRLSPSQPQSILSQPVLLRITPTIQSLYSEPVRLAFKPVGIT